MSSRRQILVVSATTCLGAACGTALAQTANPKAAPAAKLSESDPQAQALGYVDDAKRADKKRFPKYAAGQRCSACQLYQGAVTAPSAPCTLFAGKQVAGPGWCSAFVPRPA